MELPVDRWYGAIRRRHSTRGFDGTPDEFVLAVIPIGYSKKKLTMEERFLKGIARSRTRKDLTGLASGLPQAK